MGRGQKRWMAGVATALALGLPAAALAAGFDAPGSADPSQQLDTLPAGPYTNNQRDDTPTDPDYDYSEPDDPTPGATPHTNIFEERFDLFGFASALSRASARYTAGPHTGSGQVSGFNAAGAWKITRGRPDVKVAILDTGINWDNSGLRDKVALNAGELGKPQHSDGSVCSAYDCNADGAFNVDDYANDPRVHVTDGDAQSDTVLDASDLIHNSALANGTDDDHNGYVDDIAGWDFFNDDNDPQDTSSYFAAENHGTGRTEEAVEKGNDAAGSIGICPKCQFVPLRVWDTFVSDQNSFFTAVTYATDNGVKVIEGSDGGLYHSSFAEQASEYAYKHGASQVYSGDDLNTGNHNYPANYNHTMLIEGTVPDTVGLGQELPEQEGDPGFRNQLIALLGTLNAGTNLPIGSYFRGANTTQFGGHSSISMEGPTGSTNTGKASGAVALVISAALDDGVDLSADEARALLEQTAEDVLQPNTVGSGTPDPAQPGFDTHFGYGRADVGAAVKAASSGDIPPEASIGSPDWYAPLTGASAAVTGRAHARGAEFDWKLQYGPGLAPADADWHDVGPSQHSSGAPVTNFGTLDLNAIRAAVAADTHPDCLDPAGPTLVCTPNEDPYQGQFTVRLVVNSDAAGVTLDGVDRKVLTAVEDDSLRAGYPKRLGAGGEAPVRYADLNGDNAQELVVPTEDGRVHAYEPDGSELPGWPVKTEPQMVANAHLSAPAFSGADALAPPLEPPRAPTIADLTGDGVPEAITAAGERLYAWKASGDRLSGWPIHPDPTRANCATSQQAKGLKHPKCGFLATPAVGRLEGPGQPLDVVAPGLDGRLRAYRPDGTAVPGFPVRLQDPDIPDNEKMTAESINSPAIGDLDGDGRDDVIVATNEEYGGTGGGGDVSFGDLLSAAGSTARVYAVKSTGNGSDDHPFFSGWPVKPGGLIQDVLPLIGPGHDPALVKVGGQQKIVVSVTGSTVITLYDKDGENGTKQEIQQSGGGEGALNLFESSAVGNIDGAGNPEIVKYQIDVGQAANLLLVGQNVPYSHRIGAYDASSGTAKAPFPVVTDDYQFLSSSTIAKVTGGTANNVLAGTGLGLLHAYDGLTGQDAPGFPKVTGGWLFSPAAVSDDKRVSAITREGYLFEWDAADLPACQSEWPSYRHDEQGTGNYDSDGTPPEAPDRMSLTLLGGDRYRLSFRSPGDDGACGTPARYVADVNGKPLDLGAPVEGGNDFSKDFTLPAGALRAAGDVKVTVRAADGQSGDNFNLGPPGVVALGSAQGGGSVGGGGGAGGTPGNLASRCIPRKVGASGRRIGPARIGASLTALKRRYRAVRSTKNTSRFCVTRGGRFVVAARRNKIYLVATTAKGHKTRRIGPGRRLHRGRITGARRVGRGLFVGHRSGGGRVVYGSRRGKIRFLAVVKRSQAAHPRSLKRSLRRLGYR